MSCRLLIHVFRSFSATYLTEVSSVFLSSPGSCGNTSRYLAPQTGWSFGCVGCLETRTCLRPLPSHLIIACVSWRYCPWAKVKSAADRHELLRKEGIKELVRDYLRKTKHFESMIHSVCVNLIVLGTSISTKPQINLSNVYIKNYVDSSKQLLCFGIFTHHNMIDCPSSRHECKGAGQFN